MHSPVKKNNSGFTDSTIFRNRQSLPKIFDNVGTYDKYARLEKMLIYPNLEEITDVIKNSFVTIVKSPAGFGKTSAIPNFLSREEIINNAIYCAEPSITATLAALKKQNDIINNKNLVGHAYDNFVNYNHGNRIIYCNASHLLNRMLKTLQYIFRNKQESYWFCSAIILDEFHTRTKEMDICLCLWTVSYDLWKNFPNVYPKPPKLILLMNIDIDVKNLLPVQPSVLSYNMALPPIKIIFEDSPTKKFNIDTEDRYIRSVVLCYEYHKKNYEGTYMIFVPGRPETELVQTELDKLFGDTAEILVVHNELTLDEIKKIYKPVYDKRKLVVATSVAEDSVLFNDITLVIDTMTYRETRTGIDESLNCTLFWISKANSKLRKTCLGRNATRTSKKNLDIPYTYIAITSQEKYNTLQDNIIPEIEKISITYDILRLIRCGLDPKYILPRLISNNDIDINIEILKNLGFMKIGEDKNIYITEMADFCTEFPLGIRKSAMIYYLKTMYHNIASLQPSSIPIVNNAFIYLAVLCTVNFYGSGIFYFAKKNRNEEYTEYTKRLDNDKKLFHEKYAGYSDLDTIINIWIDICSQINPFYITSLKNYCRSNFLNFRRFKEIIFSLKKCIATSNRLGLYANHDLNTFAKPNREEISRIFYKLLSLTHQEYSVTINYNFNGGITAICGNIPHKIDVRSIHKAEFGGNLKQIYYALVRNKKFTKSGHLLQIINLIHTVPQEDHDDDVLSIFSSDNDTDAGSELSCGSKLNEVSKFLTISNSSDKHLNICDSDSYNSSDFEDDAEIPATNNNDHE